MVLYYTDTLRKTGTYRLSRNAFSQGKNGKSGMKRFTAYGAPGSQAVTLVYWYCNTLTIPPRYRFAFSVESERPRLS